MNRKDAESCDAHGDAGGVRGPRLGTPLARSHTRSRSHLHRQAALSTTLKTRKKLKMFLKKMEKKKCMVFEFFIFRVAHSLCGWKE